MTNKNMRALMTLVPTKYRGEIRRGKIFVPHSSQEARDLDAGGRATWDLGDADAKAAGVEKTQAKTPDKSGA